MNSSRRARALPALALIALLVVWVTTAWLCDDAFITFRTVQNLWHGDGLTWNPGERVQAYTHPAWMLFCAFGYGLSSECYFSILGLSFVLTFATALSLIYPLCASPLMAASLVFALSASSSFVQYSACGLENPLLFLLLVLFSAALRKPHAGSELLRPALLASAIALTRIDALLLIGPSCLVLLHERKTARRRALAELAIGSAPFWLWELFSLVYYGSFVPNTAIAKLNVAVPAEQLYGHGAAYFVDSLRRDPITLVVSAALALHLARRRQRRDQAVVVGLLLYVVYLLRIGGDFMSGRFCGSLLVLALAASADSLARIERTRPLLGALLAYAALWPHSPWHVQLDDGRGLGFADVVQPNGIADEHAFYYPSTGLVRVLLYRQQIVDHGWPLPPFGTAIRGRAYARSNEPLETTCMVGMFGYFAERKFVVDRCALADPFLARIEFRDAVGFRPGHFIREPSDDYLDSIVTGHNQLRDPDLAKLYERVQLLVRGPLFTSARWRAIWCLNTNSC